MLRLDLHNDQVVLRLDFHNDQLVLRLDLHNDQLVLRLVEGPIKVKMDTGRNHDLKIIFK